MMVKTSVLFIDSEQTLISELLSTLQSTTNFTFFYASTQKKVEIILRNTPIDIVFIDLTCINLETGIQILRKLNSRNSKYLAIAVVPENDEYLINKIIELDTFFYISKPYDPVEINFSLKRAADKLFFLRNKTKITLDHNDFCGIIGRAPQMLKLFDLITRVAEDDFSTVLIRGESGTGKELVAKAIHAKSKRKSKNFVPVNCAAIPDELLESELFGFTKGAFTGATQSKQGRIQYADEGTLFLDEIGDMKPSLQAKLLRVLQEKEFEPVGGLQSTPVDTRVLAATHCDLEQLVEEGKFREDLYYRLSVIPLKIPALKERREDIPLLINSFVLNYTTNRGRNEFKFSDSALRSLLKYNWRGNVRELENLIQHMSILYSGKTVEIDDLPEKFLLDENQCSDIPDLTVDPTQYISEVETIFDSLVLDNLNIVDQEMDFNKLIGDFETKLIINALRSTGGNKKEAARLLKLKRTTLLEKIKKKNLQGNY